jgi:hypothetical protein
MATDTNTELDLTGELLDQLTFHWDHQLRARFGGLTDEEYRWEPAAGAWNLRPRGEATTAMAAGGGDLVMDFEVPEPQPAPITTIAWRLGHLVVGVLGARNASHFGGPPMDYLTYEWPATAEGALAALDDGYRRWTDAVGALSPEDLARPCGPAEGPYADRSMMTLVLHIHRELIHHGAEIALLRDLYAHRPGARR